MRRSSAINYALLLVVALLVLWAGYRGAVLPVLLAVQTGKLVLFFTDPSDDEPDVLFEAGPHDDDTAVNAAICQAIEGSRVQVCRAPALHSFTGSHGQPRTL